MRLRPQLSVQPEAYNRDGRDPFLARLAMIICLASLMDFLWYPAECFDDKAPLQNCKK